MFGNGGFEAAVRLCWSSYSKQAQQVPPPPVAMLNDEGELVDLYLPRKW